MAPLSPLWETFIQVETGEVEIQSTDTLPYKNNIDSNSHNNSYYKVAVSR